MNIKYFEIITNTIYDIIINCIWLSAVDITVIYSLRRLVYNHGSRPLLTHRMTHLTAARPPYQMGHSVQYTQ